METLNYLSQDFGVAMIPANLITTLVGTLIGIIIDLLLDFGLINGVALLVPVTFALGLSPETTLILPAVVYLDCEYGGRISPVLLNIPGKASTVMITLDDYPMVRKGLAGVVLSLSVWSSFIGVFIVIRGMVLFAPLPARQAVVSDPAEYFVLMVFVIVRPDNMADGKLSKTLSVTLLGPFLPCVGIDANSGAYRFIGDNIHLTDGTQFVVLVLGLSSVGEVLLLLERAHHGWEAVKTVGRMMFSLRKAASVFLANLRCGASGFAMGVLPGAGATLVSVVVYITEKELAGAKGEFGKGDMHSLAAPEAVIDGAACGTMMPILTLGVPGSDTTAVMVDALTLYNITPGSLLFRQQPDIVWGLITSLFAVNVMLIILNVPTVRVLTHIFVAPNRALVPAIVIIIGTGAYGVRVTTFDLFLMVDIDVPGYVPYKLDSPPSSLLLGFIPGELMEQNLRRALSILNDELGILWSSSISLVTQAPAAVTPLLPLIRAWCRRTVHRTAGLADA